MLKEKLSIVIVNFNAGDFIIDCLKSIQKVSNEADISIFLVDNASSDGSIEKVSREFANEKITYILNKDNLGFGRANNLALKQINEGYILLLNPDTILKEGVISQVLDFAKSHKDCGALSCKVVFEDGSLDLSAHRGFPTPLASIRYFLFKDDSLYHLTKADFSTAHEVDAISGAFFFTSVEVLRKVGFFDEDFFLFAEDIDLCLRIKRKGYKIFYLPSVSIIHIKGVSSGLKEHSQKLTSADIEIKIKALNSFYETMKIFYKKHYEKKYPWIVSKLVYMGIDIKRFLARKNLSV